MIPESSTHLFRPEALDSYRSGRPTATGQHGRGPAPRWPMWLVAIMVLLGLGTVATVRIPTLASGTGAAASDGQVRAVFAEPPDPPVRVDQPATLVFAGRTAKARVIAVEPVRDRPAAEALGLPSSLTLPLVVVSLRAEPGTSIAGWSGQVSVETSRVTILAAMLDEIG